MTKQKERLKSRLDMSIKVVRMFDWLLDLYVLDFFVDNHWDKLPKIWRCSLQNMDPQHLGDILSKKQTSHLLPLSLLALFKTVEVLAIPRESFTKDKTKNNSNSIDLDTCKHHSKLKNLFLKHVKLKKRHEINIMADVVVDTALISKCMSVIDFGSGLGHLVRVLAYRDGMYAAGIECQSQLTEEARSVLLKT